VTAELSRTGPRKRVVFDNELKDARAKLSSRSRTSERVVGCSERGEGRDSKAAVVALLLLQSGLFEAKVLSIASESPLNGGDAYSDLIRIRESIAASTLPILPRLREASEKKWSARLISTCVQRGGLCPQSKES
jgi:hypothetical protein